MPPRTPNDLNGELFPSDNPAPKPQTQPQATAQAGTQPKSQAKPALVAHIDGGARGNPGPAGYGVFVEDEQGRKIAELSQYLGRQTNNYAEYSALIAALEYTRKHGHPVLRIMSDSELLVKQIKGIYKVRNEGLRPLYERAQRLIMELEFFRIEHVRREQNRDADRLANKAMDEGTKRG